MDDEKVKQILKVEKSLNKAADIKEDMVMILGPHMNWEEMLNPAPYSIALLGQLLLVTLEKDCSLLSDNRPHTSFELVKHPESLRASMVQVANAGWMAFNTAHKNMDQIRLYTLQVPGHVKSAVEFIVKGSNEEIQELVPDILENIDRIARNCMRNAEDVENEFVNVMMLVGELQEACTAASGDQEEKLRRNKNETSVKEELLKKKKEETKRLQNEYDEMRQTYRKMQEGYEKAMENTPSGMQIAVTQLLTDMGKAVTGSIQAVTSQFSRSSLSKMKPTTGSTMSRKDSLPGEVPKLSGYIQQMETAIEDMESTNKDQSSAAMRLTGMLEYFFKESLKEQNTIAHEYGKTLFVHICTESIQIVQELQAMGKQMTVEPGKKEGLKVRAKDVKHKMDELEVFCRNAYGCTPMPSPCPQMSDVSSSASTAQMIVEQSRMKVENAQSSYEFALKEFKESSERVGAANEKVAELLGELEHLKFDKVDFDQIKKLLRKGIKALGELREQWGKLVRFFQMMSNIIKCCLNENLKTFIQKAEMGRRFKLKYSLSDTLRDQIFIQASEANKIAYMVNNLAGMYVEVSTNHLMDQVASLGMLVSLDPEKEKKEIQKKQRELTQQAKESAKQIGELVSRKQHEFATKIQKRIDRIESEMRAVLPPPTEKDQEAERLRQEAIKAAEQVSEKRLKHEEDDDQWC